MTHLIISADTIRRNDYLIGFLNTILKKEYSQISQIYNKPDIYIIDNGPVVSIGIEEVKLFQKKMIFEPIQELYQVGIIFYSNSLTTEAQNALLKTLEEQGEQTAYILMIDNEKNLLQTIVSRCTKHFVKGSTERMVEKEMQKPDILGLDLISQFTIIDKLVTSAKEDKTLIISFITEIQKLS